MPLHQAVPDRTGSAGSTIAFVHATLLAYKNYGADPASMLRKAQIPPEVLAHPDTRITARQLEIFTEGAMRELKDETLGWFSRKLPWGTYGMLCRASLSAPNLGIALRRWFRHHLLLTDDIELTLTLSPERIATVSVLERRELGGMREFCLLSYLRFVHGYACWAIDSRIPLLQTSLPFARPRHADLYTSLFPGPVEFDAVRACFSFDAKYLALAHQRDEIALRTMLQRPLTLSIRPYRRDRLLVQRIRTVMKTSPAALGDADAVARHLHVSSRTMYRQLREEGTSFQDIKNELRREQAIHFLCRTDKPVKKIALALGFSCEKSFARAFRAWTGMTPIGYRQQMI